MDRAYTILIGLTFAFLLVAMADGLAIQLMLDPGSVDMGRVVSLWGRLAEAALESGGGTTPAD